MAATKFLFDLEFGEATKPPPEPQVALARYEADVAAAEARGRAAGAAEATAAGIAQAERHIALALDRLGDEVARLIEDVRRLEARLEREAVELAVAIARKLAGRLIEREPMTEITALAAECFAQLRATPHVVVRVHDDLLATVTERLGRIATDSGFTGRLVVLAEPDVMLGDARIEWADGGVVRDRAAQDARIDDLVRRYLDGRAEALADGSRAP